jgi:hypothetical protein
VSITSVLGPGSVLGAVCVLAVALRWIIADGPRRHRRPRSGPAPADDDFGLLRSVAVVDDPDTGRSVRALLVAAGVRATVATDRAGRVHVLVFPSEHARALRLVSWVL